MLISTYVGKNVTTSTKFMLLREEDNRNREFIICSLGGKENVVVNWFVAE